MDGVNKVFGFLAILLHIVISPTFIMTIIAASEIAVLLSVARSRGEMIYKSSKRNIIPMIVLGSLIGFVVFLSLQWDLKPGIAAIALFVVSVPALPFAIRGAFAGIYENLIISPNFICKWDKIERVDENGKVIRLTHVTKGATEFSISGSFRKQVFERVQKRFEISNRKSTIDVS